MKRLLRVTIGQRNIGKQWGVIAQVMGQVGIFVAIMNLVLITVTAYNTTLSGWFVERGIGIGFWLFVSIIICLLVAVAVLIYRFALPSFFSFTNDQLYRHDNPIRQDIAKVQKTLDKKFRKMNERLEKLEKK